MSLKLPMIIHAVVSRQDLVDDTVTYEVEVSVLNVQMRIPCPPALLDRVDQYIRGDAEPQQPPPMQQTQHLHQQQRRSNMETLLQNAQARARNVMDDLDGYEVGVVDGYGD